MFRSVFCWRLVKTLNPHRRRREKPSKHDDGVPGLLPVGLYALALPESSPRPSVTIPHAKTGKTGVPPHSVKRWTRSAARAVAPAFRTLFVQAGRSASPR